MTHQEKFDELKSDVIKSIESFMKDKNVFYLWTEEMEDKDTLFFDLPFYLYFSEFGFYDDYKIISIEKCQDKLVFNSLNCQDETYRNIDLDDTIINLDNLIYVESYLIEKN